jgi:streptomycin 6-kinase
MELPKRLVEQVTRGWGDQGRAWLEELPDLLNQCACRWGLTLGLPTEAIKVNYVGYVTLKDGTEAVLKVAVPHTDFTTEKEALAIYGGRGINRLIDRDDELNAILLERLRPGKMLAHHPDRAERAKITGCILMDLHTTPPPSEHGLPHFESWMHGAFGDIRGCKDLERSQPYLDQIPRAQDMMDQLKKPGEPQLLLHGDLHHWNILEDAQRGWMGIDPKGVIGASCLDVGRYVNNASVFKDHSDRNEKREILLETLRIFSDALGESEERMFTGTYLDKITGSGWGLADPPGEREMQSREGLEVIVELGEERGWLG